MATALTVVNEWASDSEDKQLLVKQQSGLVLRWLNEAQLRFVDRANNLRDVWTPTITSSGNVSLPSDFIREIPDLVKYDLNSTVQPPLKKIDYAVATNIQWGGRTHYSIHNGKMYVWSAGALTPSVTYIKKPAALTTLSSDDLTVDSTNFQDIIYFLELKWLYRTKQINLIQYSAMMRDFEDRATQEGVKFIVATDSMTVRNGGL